jgi:hypothetical protein
MADAERDCSGLGLDGRPLDFATFLLSLGTSALVQLGEAPDPEGNTLAVDLDAARQTIDILGLLQCKTEGNLDAKEAKLLSKLLYDLRIRYVQANARAS